MNTAFTALWIGWIVGFFAIEGVALKRKAPGDTLSEHFRHWFHVRKTWGRWAWLATSGLFFAWFVPHILGAPGL